MELVGDRQVTTDAKGRYSIAVTTEAALLTIGKAGQTSVDRQVAVSPAGGTVTIDARLTALALPDAIAPEGGTLSAGPIQVAIGAGSGGSYRLTRMTAQGLPNVLPLGWSPAASFRLDGPGGGMSASVGGLPAGTYHLAQYRPGTRAWHLVQAGVPVTSGTATAPLPAPGSYALVAADVPELVPPVDEPLPGLEMAALPNDVSSRGSVTPPTLSPAGGTAAGDLILEPGGALPSGTLVHAEVRETYTLAAGSQASEEMRRMDVLVYRDPLLGTPAGVRGCTAGALCATFPITPSRTYETAELTSGTVHLDILAGRELVRGVLGGNEALTTEMDGIRLTVPAGSLPEDAAFAMGGSGLSSFVPQTPGLQALAELSLAFSGQTLAFGAELSIDATSLPTDGTYLVAQVVRFEGIPYLAVVAQAEREGARVVTRPAPGLPGVRTEGRYVFYRAAVPVGFVAGAVSPAAGTPLVRATGTGALPLIGYSTTDGAYILAASAGATTVSAQIPRTALAGQAATTVVAGETTTLPIALLGTVTTATVTPPDGAQGVSDGTTLLISASSRLDATTINPTNVRLEKQGTTPTDVPLSLQVSLSGTNVTVVPQNGLEPGATYRLTAGNIRDAFGQAVVVPSSTFTTKALEVPADAADALLFSMPNANGEVTITAAPGSFTSGTQFLVVNMKTAFVSGFSARGDGSVSETFPATIDHALMVTITFPDGNSVSFTKSQFVAPDGSVAIGPGGGVVAGEGGIELRFPEGALDKGVVFKIEPHTFPATEPFPSFFDASNPEFANAVSIPGGGLKIQASDPSVTFKKEVDVAFPLPDLSALPAGTPPEDAFYYVVRRIEAPPATQGGPPRYAYETLDHAHVEIQKDGSKKVVTASPPFSGLTDLINGVAASATAPGGWIASVGNTFLGLMATFQATLPGKPLPLAVHGKVVQPIFEPGKTEPTFQAPGERVPVWVVDHPVEQAPDPQNPKPPFEHRLTNADGQETPEGWVTFTQPGTGTFTLWDNRGQGGVYKAVAQYEGKRYSASLIDSNPLDWNTPALRLYQNVLYASITLAPKQAPPPPPLVTLKVMETPTTTTRKEIGGVVLAGTKLLVGTKVRKDTGEVLALETLEITQAGASQSLSRKIDPWKSDPNKAKDALAMDEVAEHTPEAAGTYTVLARVQPAFGPPIEVTKTFRVITAGGGAIDPLPNDAPRILDPTVPKQGATGVPVNVLPQVSFSEPVRGVVPGNIAFVQVNDDDTDGEAVTFKVSAVVVKEDGTLEAVEDLTNATRYVTSATLVPASSLTYGKRYRLRFSEQIADKDSAQPNDPKELVQPALVGFATFDPLVLTEATKGTGSPGLLVIEDRGYRVSVDPMVGGYLETYDLSDPVSPALMDETTNPSDNWVRGPGRPVDLTGEEVEDERAVVVATGPWAKSAPSNLQLFGVSSALGSTGQEKKTWLGAISLTSSAADGYPKRLRIKDGVIYSATEKKGIQRVTMDALIDNLGRYEPFSVQWWAAYRALSTDGQGSGIENVQTFRVNAPPSATGGPAEVERLNDLRVADLNVSGSQARVVVATGGWYYTDRPHYAYVVVNPATTAVTQKAVEKSIATATGTGLVRLRIGEALAVGRIQDRDIAILAGSGEKPDENGQPTPTGLLVVLDVTRDAREPELLGYLTLPSGTPFYDIVLSEEKAFVGHATTTSIVSLADLSSPRLVGTITGVGGRIAIGENGILYGSAFRPFGGSDLDEGGVKTATVGPIALVDTDPARLVVGDRPDLPLRVAEPFKLKYRVIPKAYPVEGESHVEIRLGEVTVAQFAAPIPKDGVDQGRGEIPMLVGYDIPRVGGLVARPRLVVNAGLESQIAGPPRAWVLDPLKVGPAPEDKDRDDTNPGVDVKHDAMTSDTPSIPVDVVSEEWSRRLTDATPDKPAQAHALFFELQGPPGGSLSPLFRNEDDGLYEAVLQPGSKAGETYEIAVKAGDVVITKSEPILVEPGKASDVSIVTEGERARMPADGATEVKLTLTAMDVAGNLVADGTVVVWEVRGDADLVEVQSETTNGRATATLRAGAHFIGAIVVEALVDEATGAVTVQQDPVTITLSSVEEIGLLDTLDIDLSFASAGGPIAPGAPLHLYSDLGEFTILQPIQNDSARVRWSAIPRVGYRNRFWVAAAIGYWKQSKLIRWRATWSPPGGPGDGGGSPPATIEAPLVSIEPLVIAGDKSASGTAPLELPDGTVEDVPYRAHATYSLVGLTPGERVRIQLGTTAMPNVPPLAAYTAEEPIEEGVVADSIGGHDGSTTGGLSIASDGYRGLAFELDGTAVVAIPHHEDFEFTGAFMVQGAVRPPPDSDGGVLVEKAGEYRLSVVRDDGALRARLTVWTDTGEEVATSGAVVPEGIWSLLTGRYAQGRLFVSVGDAEIFTPTISTPSKGTAEILIGPGFIGGLDEIRITDLSAAPLLTFGNGQDGLSFVADETGTFSVDIYSTGQQAVRQAARYYRGLPTGAFGLAADEPDLTAAAISPEFVGIRTYWEDRALQSDTRIGCAGYGVMLIMAKVAEGILGGNTGEADIAVIGGDMLGSILLKPFTAARDIINVIDRAIQNKNTGWDALVLAGALPDIAAAVVGKKGPIVGTLGKVKRFAKVVGAGSRVADALGPVARLLSKDVKELVTGAGKLVRVERLVELAAGGSQVLKQSIGDLLRGIGRRAPQIDNIERLARHADDAEEVLPAARQAMDEVGTRPFNHLLRGVVGCAIATGAPAAGAVPTSVCAASTKKAVQGAVAAAKELETFIKPRSGVVPRVVAAQVVERIGKRADAVPVFEELAELSAKGRPIGAISRNLGSNSERAQLGATFVLDTYRKVIKPAGGAAIEFEKKQSLVPVVGKAFSRFYDLFDGSIFYECKNWLWHQGFNNPLFDGFPPPAPSIFRMSPGDFFRSLRRWDALWAAEGQWIKDIALFGTRAPGELRWVFPKAMEPFASTIRLHFMKLLESRKLREYMAGSDPERLRAYEAAVRAVKENIANIIIFQ